MFKVILREIDCVINKYYLKAKKQKHFFPKYQNNLILNK